MQLLQQEEDTFKTTRGNTSRLTTKYSRKTAKRDQFGRFLTGHRHGRFVETLPIKAGQKFGSWRVLSQEPLRKNGYLHVEALCEDCGKKYEVSWDNLKKGITNRCGRCGMKKARQTKDLAIWGRSLDGMDRVLSQRWDAMMRRCYDPSNRGFKQYGALGVKVHPAFHNKVDYANYAKALPNANIDREIDRIDTFGNYEPGNIRWVTRKENCRNLRTTIWTTFKGEKISSKEFAERYVHKFLPQTVARLAKRGLTGEEILERESRCTRAGLRYRKRREAAQVRDS